MHEMYLVEFLLKYISIVGQCSIIYDKVLLIKVNSEHFPLHELKVPQFV